MKLDKDKNDWLSDPALLRLVSAFDPGSVRAVGGCVRNSLMERAVGDIDLAAQSEPKAVMARLKKAKIRYVETGVAYGTVTAIVDGRPFEITSLRRDVETDGRRAVVAYTTDWAEDALRRDLTMNALYADFEGEIFDPTDQGLADVSNNVFRFVGKAADRVREDYLRILRLFRLLAWYGNPGRIDSGALKACRTYKDGINRLSSERIWSEVKKLLSAPNPSRALRIMQTNDILEEVLPEASNAEGADLLIALEQGNALAVDPMRRLMSMAGRDEVAMAKLSRRLKLSKAEKTRLLGWAMSREPIEPDMDERSAKVAIYHMGAQTAEDRFIIRAAGAKDDMQADQWLSLARLAHTWTPPEFPISGDDLKSAGVKPGPDLGRTLDALRALWVRSGFTAGREQLLMALTLLGGQT